MGVIEERISALVRKQEQVMEEYGRSRQQARETLDRGDLPRLDAEANRLKGEYEALTSEIPRLRTEALRHRQVRRAVAPIEPGSTRY